MSEDTRGSARPWVFLALALLLPLFILFPTLFFPYWRDQSVFAYVGEVIVRGGMPYRDAWDLKPPGIYLAYAAVTALARGGPEALMLALRVTDLLIAGAVGLLLALLALRWRREGVLLGAGAAAWYAALYLQGGYGATAQAETWANLPALGAALLLLHAARGEKPRTGPLLAAGVLVGVVAVLKFTAVLPLLPFLLGVLPGARASCPQVTNPSQAHRARGQRSGDTPPALSTPLPSAVRAAKRALLLLAGAAIPLLSVFAWLQAGGAWGDYLEIQRGFVTPYVRLNTPDLGARFAAVLGGTWGFIRLASVPLVLAAWGAWSAKGWESRGRAACIAAFALGVLSVWVQGKFFRYHWQPALPWLALLAAAGTADLFGRLRGLSPRPALAAAVAAPALFWALATQWGYYKDAALLAAGRMPRDAWLARFESTGSVSSARTNRAAAEYVRSHTRPGDRILVWGFEPTVYQFSGRSCPTRFFFNVPVAVEFTPPAWRRELLRDLAAAPPELVLVARRDAIPWANGREDDSEAQLRSWPELRGWLEGGYRQETEIEHFVVYRRANVSAPNSSEAGRLQGSPPR